MSFLPAPMYSILEGGFTAAAQYLHQPGSPLSLTAALVDCDRAALESLLGIPPSANTAQQAQQGKRDSFVSYLAESSAAAPSKLLSVGSLFGSKGGAAGASTEGARSPSPVPSASHSATSSAATNAASTGPAAAPQNSTAAAPSAPATAAASDGPEEGGGTKQLFSSWGKRLSVLGSSSLESIKKVASASAAVISVASESTAAQQQPAPASTPAEDEEGDDGMGPREFPDTTGVAISRTEKEREQALALHKMAGLRKGDSVMINRQDLPGAILFPSIKYKEVLVDATTAPQEGAGSGEAGAVTDSTVSTEGGSAAGAEKVKQQVQVHRYLVVSRERFIVLDAYGGGVGSRATVKSNRHLTEVGLLIRWVAIVSLFEITRCARYLAIADQDDVQEEGPGAGDAVLRGAGAAAGQGPAVPGQQATGVRHRAAGTVPTVVTARCVPAEGNRQLANLLLSLEKHGALPVIGSARIHNSSFCCYHGSAQSAIQ
jgi:hypothetical protein